MDPWHRLRRHERGRPRGARGGLGKRGPANGGVGWFVGVAAAVLKRPSLWVEAGRVVFRFARRGWWRSWPPLPVPPREYLAFRIQTNSGGVADSGDATVSPQAAPQPGDVVAFLKWTGSNRHVLG